MELSVTEVGKSKFGGDQEFNFGHKLEAHIRYPRIDVT